MAGFDKVKRKISRIVPGQEPVVIFEDLNAFEVEYQKFYSDDEMLGFAHELFMKLGVNLNKGRYVFEVDTLGAYIDARVVYEIATEVTCKAVEANLDPEYGPSLKEEPVVMFTRKEF